MLWDGFASWADVASDSLIHGLEFGLAAGGVAILISYGIGSLVGLYRAAVGA